MDSIAILQRLGGGLLLEELREALIATAEEVVATGKPGSVTLTLKISTKSQFDPFIAIDETLQRKPPGKDARGAWVYALDGDFHRDDPRQTRLDFREIDRETGEIRTRDDRATTVREVGG